MIYKDSLDYAIIEESENLNGDKVEFPDGAIGFLFIHSDISSDIDKFLGLDIGYLICYVDLEDRYRVGSRRLAPGAIAAGKLLKMTKLDNILY